MRYLIFIVGISLIFTLLILGQFMTVPRNYHDYALRINERIVSSSELSTIHDSFTENHDEQDNFINTVVTRELLIQEAKRQKIDHEETFRAAIQRYYEQTLITGLLARQEATQEGAVTEEEVSRYLQLAESRVELVLCPMDNNGTPQRIDDRFVNLAFDLQMASLPCSSNGEKIQTTLFGKPYELALLRMETDSTGGNEKAGEFTREQAYELIARYRRQQGLARWLEELRRQATVEQRAATAIPSPST